MGTTWGTTRKAAAAAAAPFPSTYRKVTIALFFVPPTTFVQSNAEKVAKVKRKMVAIKEALTKGMWSGKSLHVLSPKAFKLWYPCLHLNRSAFLPLLAAAPENLVNPNRVFFKGREAMAQTTSEGLASLERMIEAVNEVLLEIEAQ
ncbi:MAG: hypothetical protein J3Q66DRAFT_364690 [Benniella sp.]|nr:MAG: hypothetical protein J3Q66DRAFT_364690 [Benniella sp.]